MEEKWFSLREAVESINDNDTVAVCESPLDRSPTAITMEMIRRRLHGLTLISPLGGYSSDLLIGAGLVKKICTAYMGFELLGLAPCFRRAVENQEIDVEDYSNLAIFARLRAGATGVPFYPLKAILGSDIMLNLAKQEKAKEIECPFTGEKVCVVPALTPDVTIMHAQRADLYGNIQVDGADWLAQDLAMASKRVIATVEKRIDSRSQKMQARNTIQGAIIPNMLVDAVACVPYGAHPTSCFGHYDLDKEHLERYVKESINPEKFSGYLQRFVYGTRSHLDYLRLVSVSGFFASARARKGEHAMKMKSASEELMLIAGSRQIHDGETILAGTGQPLVSVALAKVLHAPNITVFVAGTMNPSICELPLGGSDINLFRKCTAIVGYRQLYELLQARYIDTGVAGAAQIDKYGNVNTTLIGSSWNPTTRLPGSGGGNDIASLAKKTILIMPLERKRFVEKLDYLTSPGFISGPDARRRLGLRGNGPTKVVTTMGIFGFDSVTKEMRLEAVYPGFEIPEIQNNIGFKLTIPEQVTEVEPPTRREVCMVRKLLRENPCR